jgi:hypothetical protein
MVKTWRVRLELARDDDGSLSDEAVDALTHLLTESQEEPVLSRGDDGTVLVQMTVDADNDMGARSAAESTLRHSANSILMAVQAPPPRSSVHTSECPHRVPRRGRTIESIGCHD